MIKTILIIVLWSFMLWGAIFVNGAKISGRVYCSSVGGLEHVMVTDGFAVTYTDSDGNYELQSNKKSGLVYITIPKGYMPYARLNSSAAQKIFSPYWQILDYPTLPNRDEPDHDFRLREENNVKHVMIFAADPQLSNRGTEDLTYYTSRFIPRVKKEVADAGTVPVYTIMLGDETFDEYWYSKNYSPSTFVSTQVNNNYPTRIFPVMGNHDHDGATPSSDSTDFEAAKVFRKNFGPNYYSMNIGNVHYIILDNMEYLNTYDATQAANYATGIVGNRNYLEHVTDYQIKWLEEDLKNVDKSTPIFLCLHGPLWGIKSDFTVNSLRNFSVGGTSHLCRLLKDYEKVEIMGGHRHIYQNPSPSDFPNVQEHTVGAVGGNLYWAGHYSTHINGRDGTPGGYEAFFIDDKDYNWIYRDCEPNEDGAQFRVIDVNTWKELYKTSDYQNVFTRRASSNYENPTDYMKNMVLINVFNYDNNWKVEVTENGNPLKVYKHYGQDVYHILTCDIPRCLKSTTISDEMSCGYTTHLFKVYASSSTSTLDVKVTDRFGNEFSRTVTMPIPCTIDALKAQNEVKLATGIKHLKSLLEVVKITSQGSRICIDTENPCMANIVRMDGTEQVKTLVAGHNEFLMPCRGLYIVRVGKETKKLFVK